jgi:nucleoside-diphosphate-sugar epimerase
MRVLVTGGTRFVGCHTGVALVGHGHRGRYLTAPLAELGLRDPSQVGGPSHARTT